MPKALLKIIETTFILLLASPTFSLSQPKVDPGHLYERWICVVPMTGTGTYDDPRRPGLPLPVSHDEEGAPNHLDLLSFTYQLSDDGRFALVELAARNRETLLNILPFIHPGTRIFEKGKHQRADLIRELRKFKKDFLPQPWGVRLP